MRRLAPNERGSVMITAILLIGIMLAVGLAAMSRVDTQTEETRRERVRESTFNYAEGALSAQIFVLGRRGAGTAAQPYPDTCPLEGATFCADPAQLSLNYDPEINKDFASGAVEWTTWVRDNEETGGGGATDTFWRDSVLTTRPRYDANKDDLMWVRAQATVRDRTRAMVGLIRLEKRQVAFPAFAILSGRFRTTNNGKHSDVIVNSLGSLGVQTRCEIPAGQDYTDANGCLEFEPQQEQISPVDKVFTSYDGPVTAVSEDDLDALMDVAKANGTYYTSCPSSVGGKVVVIDTASECNYQGNTQYNSPNDPGLLIVTRGKLEFRGTVKYHGLVYHANLDNSNAWDLVKVHGNAQVIGGVVVDGDGGLEAGASGKQNLLFSPNAFNDITSFGTAGVVQNTWREIQPLALN